MWCFLLVESNRDALQCFVSIAGIKASVRLLVSGPILDLFQNIATPNTDIFREGEII